MFSKQSFRFVVFLWFVVFFFFAFLTMHTGRLSATSLYLRRQIKMFVLCVQAQILLGMNGLLFGGQVAVLTQEHDKLVI